MDPMAMAPSMSMLSVAFGSSVALFSRFTKESDKSKESEEQIKAALGVTDENQAGSENSAAPGQEGLSIGVTADFSGSPQGVAGQNNDNDDKASEAEGAEGAASASSLGADSQQNRAAAPGSNGDGASGNADPTIDAYLKQVSIDGGTRLKLPKVVTLKFPGSLLRFKNGKNKGKEGEEDNKEGQQQLPLDVAPQHLKVEQAPEGTKMVDSDDSWKKPEVVEDEVTKTPDEITADKAGEAIKGGGGGRRNHARPVSTLMRALKRRYIGSKTKTTST